MSDDISVALQIYTEYKLKKPSKKGLSSLVFTALSAKPSTEPPSKEQIFVEIGYISGDGALNTKHFVLTARIVNDSIFPTNIKYLW